MVDESYEVLFGVTISDHKPVYKLMKIDSEQDGTSEIWEKVCFGCK